jgi:hypothetical protein
MLRLLKGVFKMGQQEDKENKNNTGQPNSIIHDILEIDERKASFLVVLAVVIILYVMFAPTVRDIPENWASILETIVWGIVCVNSIQGIQPTLNMMSTWLSTRKTGSNVPTQGFGSSYTQPTYSQPSYTVPSYSYNQPTYTQPMDVTPDISVVINDGITPNENEQ